MSSMNIIVSKGVGDGVTPLAAFDAALMNAGVANYNLICLSSVIPAASTVQRAKFVTPPDEHGFKLYVVMARKDEQVHGESAWAGLGWTQNYNDGCGLFVEVQGSDCSSVEKDIHSTLESMVAARTIKFDFLENEIVGITCKDKPVCAVVIAVYKSESWGQ